MSLALIILGCLGLGIEQHWMRLIKSIDFNKTLMVGMLSFLLFAGALHVDINELLKQKWRIGIFSTIGVIISTILIGVSTYFILGWIGLNLKLIHCLLFGALISPTDPIAVLSILKKAGAPKSIEVQISGESLFNDGIGVVLFIVLMAMAVGKPQITFSNALLLFTEETLGGVILGLLLGWIAYGILKSIDNYQVEILVTLSVVAGGYAFASAINLSGPLAIVVAGMLIGNRGRKFAMSEKTRQNLDMFWELVDDILNSILFILIGLELLIIPLSVPYLVAAVVSIPVVILSRFVSIGLPLRLLTLKGQYDFRTLKIMTWGGLRGGIAVALALSLPSGFQKDIIITMTYVVVVFSILVQGLTFKYLIKT
jgi:CPA1 family monovalent cation:H+ antiporter